VGFVGVLIVTEPGAGTIQLGAFFALANAVLISSVAVAIRRMSLTESTETLTLYQMMVITFCTLFLLPFGFTPPTWLDASAMALAGIGNGVAQYWWTRSLSLAPPSAVVPFNYLSLVWATLLGFAIWGDIPTPHLLVGAAVVVASGLYLLWRETLRSRRVRTTRPTNPEPTKTDPAGRQSPSAGQASPRITGTG
jgi:drug/metabolite transporter (DMT)-like permease